MDKNIIDTSYVIISEDIKDPIDDVFDELEDEEITAKIPNIDLKEKCNIGNGEIINNYKIVLLQCKEEYKDYYGDRIYGIILRSETNEFWFGIPIDNQNLGMVTWAKDVWKRVYAFRLQFNMHPEF